MVTMGESSSLDILSTQSNVNPFLQQRTECHGFSKCPINDTILNHLHAGLQDPL
jgi:hypothetical protein